LTQQQQEICVALLLPPHRVLVRAAHAVRKTWVAACLISWFFDSFPRGLCLSTAPTDQRLKDVLWREIRTIRERRGLGGFRGPHMARLETSPDHFACGYTSRDSESFQGRHAESMFFVFDEAGEPVGFRFCYPIFSSARAA
jgi:hypothetical protein